MSANTFTNERDAITKKVGDKAHRRQPHSLFSSNPRYQSNVTQEPGSYAINSLKHTPSQRDYPAKQENEMELLCVRSSNQPRYSRESQGFQDCLSRVGEDYTDTTDLLNFKNDDLSAQMFNPTESDTENQNHETLSIFYCDDELDFSPIIKDNLNAPFHQSGLLSKSGLGSVNVPPLSHFNVDYKGDLGSSLDCRKASDVNKAGCSCKKSMCLKLYCSCFASGLGCGPQCNCCDCLNLDENPVLRKIFNEDLDRKQEQTDNAEIKVEKVTTEGCSCRKTGCSKKYCECFKLGMSCGASCRCSGCQNGRCGTHNSSDEVPIKKTIRKVKKRPLSFNNFIEKLKLFNLLNKASTPSP